MMEVRETQDESHPFRRERFGRNQNLIELAGLVDFFKIVERPQHRAAMDDLAQLEAVVIRESDESQAPAAP